MNIIKSVNNHLLNTSKGSGLRTGDVRKISAKIYKSLEDKSIENILDLSEQLLKTGEWAHWLIAYDWAFRVRNQYTLTTYATFEQWLINYVTNWDDCDDFCTHAFGELLAQYNELFPKVLELAKHERFPVRRAIAVLLIYPIRYDRSGDINPFLVSDALMNDEHYLVLKGYGWMLKVLAQYRQEDVIKYLLDNKDRMPRIAFRYAVEKFDKTTKNRLMSAL